MNEFATPRISPSYSLTTHPSIAGFPRLSSRVVHRERLTDQLDRLAALTLVQAPPGYGKTVATAIWARQRAEQGDIVVWVRCTPQMNEPGVLLLDALADSIIRTGLIAAADLGGGDHPLPLVSALTARDDRRVIVVLDRFGRVTEPASLDALVQLIGVIPSLHVLATSRVPHPVGATAEEHGVDIDRITARSLAATPEELTSLASSWGYQVDEDTAARLTQMTGGWLELARRVLGSPSFDDRFDSSTGTAGAYITDVVLPSIGDAKLARQIMRMSLATPVITPGHLSALGSGGWRLSRALRNEGLLEEVTPVGEGPVHWRFAPLVRLALEEHFTDSAPGDAAQAHREFAETLYADGEGTAFDLVLMHARAGRHWSLLSRVWLKHALMLLHKFPSETKQAYGDLPDAALRAEPALRLAVAREFLSPHASFASQGAPGSLEDIAGALVAGLNSTSSIDEVTAAFTTQIAARRSQGRLTEAIALAERLSKRLGDARRRGIVPAPMRVAWFLMQWAKTLMLSGDVMSAIETTQRAYSAAKGPGAAWIAGSAAGHLALLHTTIGDVSQVQHWIELARDAGEVDQELDRHVMLPARLAGVFLAVSRLDQSAASLLLQQLDTEAQLGEFWPYVALAQTSYQLAFGDPVTAYERLTQLSAVRADELADDRAAARLIERCTADALLAMGEANRARRYLDDAAARFRANTTTGPTDARSVDLPWLRMPSVVFALIVGDNEFALRFASAAIWFADMSPRDRAELLMVRACAALRLGSEQSAVESFTRATVMSEQSQTLYPYLVIPESSLRELASLAAFVLPPELERHLAARGSRFPDHSAYIELSPRELTVLHHMTRHATLSDIAKALTVSTNTVKTQSAAIYAKLGVREREAAIARAQELGFLPGV